MKKTIVLEHAIQVDGVDVTELKMRRPKVRDMLVADKHDGNQGSKEVLMFANLCEVDSSVIEDLDLADYQRMQECYQGFLS